MLPTLTQLARLSQGYTLALPTLRRSLTVAALCTAVLAGIRQSFDSGIQGNRPSSRTVARRNFTAAAHRSMATTATQSAVTAASSIDLKDPRWDRLGVRMNQFHAYFRMEFKQIYSLADQYEAHGLSLSEFLHHAEELHQHLHMHHTIEEVHIFPVLATRMPEFRKATGSHLKQHEGIHEGLDKYSAYLKKCLKEPSAYSADSLRSIMTDFETVLFQHLDEEVESLKGPNMSKYWKIEELASIPM